MKRHLQLWQETDTGVFWSACGIKETCEKFFYNVPGFLLQTDDVCKKCAKIYAKKPW
ncbi:hypothetical protein LCGC14_2261640 [marine sediment metagenome]|uniref:Uncharacterized protein n=1 Tax=marine sediment metagenome TaxID=412755 RepID=A0A0F9CZJ7_9ZZZZ